MEGRMKELLLVSLVVLFLFRSNCADELAKPPQGYQQIVLVHGGAGLGAWCWYKLIPLLRSSGYNVTAIDLAAAGIDPRQISDIPLMEDYYQPLRDFMASLPPQEKVMLVGHSLNGLAVSYSMELFPHKIYVAVFVTAIMPAPAPAPAPAPTYNMSMPNTHVHNMETNGNGTSNPPTVFTVGDEELRTNLFQLSPVEDWVLATLLKRSTPLYDEELRLSHERYGSVKRVFIITGCDKEITPSSQRDTIARNPPNEVHEIATADHMVMTSRTNELSVRLIDIAQRYHNLEPSFTAGVTPTIQF